METVLVVGGGITGLVSALQLKKQHKQVVLIEKAPQVGGLLGSYYNEAGVAFDLGTHYVSETGCSELDQILLHGVKDSTEWFELAKLPTASYFAGQLNEYSNCINTNALPKTVQEQGLLDLLNVEQPVAAPVNARQQLQQFYGKTFEEHVFSPLLQKLFAESSDRLAPNAHLLFVSPRLLILSAERTRELKQSEFFDARIAFHSYREGAAGKRVFYPKQGGIASWVLLLRRQLEQAGVRIITQAEITSLQRQDNRITSVEINNAETFTTSQLVWSVSPHLLARLLEIAPTKGTLQFRKTVLVHLIFDRPFLSEVVYVTCYDDNLKTFRVTLYPNIALQAQGHSTEPYKCTVEFITDGTDLSADWESIAVSELRVMGLIAADAEKVFSHSAVLPAGFPVMTNEFMQASSDLAQALQQQADNLLILGKAKGSNFFMRDVLVEAFNEIAERLSHYRNKV